MTMSKPLPMVLNDYEYMNEDSIDNELKCSLCMQPFRAPVSAGCGHTFCQECISQWVMHSATCPTCRNRTQAKEFQPISIRVVINQLERLRMKCKRCNQANIERGNINEHEKRCPNQSVSCPAFDIKCKWKGKRNELPEHLLQCPFQKIRPAIDDIYEHLKNIYEPLVDELQAMRQQLEKEIKRNSEQNHFLITVFNKGKPMSDRCCNQYRNCQLQQIIRMNTKSGQMQQAQLSMQRIIRQPPVKEFWSQGQYQNEFPADSLLHCSNCLNECLANDIALHHCEGDFVCRTCVEQYGNTS